MEVSKSNSYGHRRIKDEIKEEIEKKKETEVLKKIITKGKIKEKTEKKDPTLVAKIRKSYVPGDSGGIKNIKKQR